MLYKYLPECKVIKLPDFTHTSPNHLNGVHPLHYTQDTYAYIERALDVICRYSNANTLENLRKEQSLKNKIETRVANMAFVYGLQKQIQDLQKQLQDLKKILNTLCKGGVTAKHDEEEITLVDTFGSCVSRDVFRFDKDHRYKVNVSIQRNPITCMFQKKLVYEKKLKGATLAYERKMLDMQFEQSAINRLKKSSSDILVMDLGEERLARYLFEYKGNEFCYATTSRVDQLYQELFEDKDVALKKKILPFEIDEEILKERLAKFVKCIVRSESNPDGYEEKNIYVLETLYAEKIISNKGWIRNYAEDYHVKEQNDMYKKMYAILYALMPRCNVIKLPQFTYSSENHMWGGHPLHYTNETYEYILDVLDVCIRHSMISSPDKIYQERSLKNRMYLRILNGTDLYKIKTLEQKLNQIEVQLQEMEADGK